jgi:type I site-specific restriction endonuclease
MNQRRPVLTPEARARQSIDALLVAAGWAVQDLRQARIVAEVEANLQRALTILARPFVAGSGQT